MCSDYDLEHLCSKFMSPAPKFFFRMWISSFVSPWTEIRTLSPKDLLIFVECNDWLVLWKSLEHLLISNQIWFNIVPDLGTLELHRPAPGYHMRTLSRCRPCRGSFPEQNGTRLWPGPAILETALRVKLGGVLIPRFPFEAHMIPISKGYTREKMVSTLW